MPEQQEPTPFDFHTIPGYTRLTGLEKELDKIEEQYDKPTKMVAPEKRLAGVFDQIREAIIALKHPILESKEGEIKKTDLDDLEEQIRQLQSQITSLKRTKHG